MKHPEIWARFVTTSQHMENVLFDVDLEYPWGGNGAINVGEIGLPPRTSGQPVPGLRDLYCYWIDGALANIESEAAAWLPAATANFRAEHGSDGDGKKWLNNVLNSRGGIQLSGLKLPHTLNTHSRPNRANPDIWAASNYKDLWVKTGAAGPF